MCGSLSVYLAHSLRATGQQSCKTNNNNKTYNNNNNNKKNKCKFKCRIFILEDGNPTDGRGCCLTETKTIFLFSLFASEFTNWQTDRKTRIGSCRPQSFRSGGSVVSGAPAVFFADPVASAGRVDAAVVAVLVAAEEGVGRVQLASGTPAKKVHELFELLVPAELLPSLRLRRLRLLPLSLLLLQQLLLLLFRLLLLLLLLKQKKKVIFVKIAGERKREGGRKGGMDTTKFGERKIK